MVVVVSVFGQAPNHDSTIQTGNDGSVDAQRQSGNSDPSRSSNPTPASQNPPQGNQHQPLNVNPLTGLTSASALDYHPLSGKQRWYLYWKQNYWSVGAYLGPFLTALMPDQATNSPEQWGGGLQGYGRRLGSRTATGMVQGTFQASIAAVMHEDVRYIASAHKGFKERALHAMAYSFLTYNNQGHAVVNIANLSSFYAATAISTMWLPGRSRGAKYILSDGTMQIGLSIPINLLQEFWPDIRYKLLHRPEPATHHFPQGP
jgi:hypothetical protein